MDITRDGLLLEARTLAERARLGALTADEMQRVAVVLTALPALMEADHDLAHASRDYIATLGRDFSAARDLVAQASDMLGTLSVGPRLVREKKTA